MFMIYREYIAAALVIQFDTYFCRDEDVALYTENPLWNEFICATLDVMFGVWIRSMSKSKDFWTSLRKCLGKRAATRWPQVTIKWTVTLKEVAHLLCQHYCKVNLEESETNNQELLMRTRNRTVPISEKAVKETLESEKLEFRKSFGGVRNFPKKTDSDSTTGAAAQRTESSGSVMINEYMFLRETVRKALVLNETLRERCADLKAIDWNGSLSFFFWRRLLVIIANPNDIEVPLFDTSNFKAAMFSHLRFTRL